jgi:Asp-tRNA(Asn)/Glu-tRNA(Gln) amidotransferase A subunit family amidase
MKHIYSLFLKDTNAKEMLRMHKEMDDLKKEFMREWRKLDLDILITPVTPFTALLPDSTEYLVFQLAYCCFQNVLELPAGVIPTRLVKAEETIYTASNIFEKEAEASIRRSEGMPLAIQVTGRHMMDE